ncbi:hypothetical protein [Sphingorhabdus sp.]|uniref:hypothetical protein n=1 Tax=Sphingorhabdus sp. TaxID=1902408 RepID=UPI003D81B5AA
MAEEALELEKHILDFFLASARKGSFNGVLASIAVKAHLPTECPLAVIAQLIEADRIDGVFACRDTNPHIKRLPVLPKEKQVELVQSAELNSFCLYPSSKVLAENVTQSEFSDRPFSRAMLLGEAQLSYVTFDLGVLGRYRSDPRFIVKFHDYMGDMFISDAYYSSAEVPERDKIGVDSFGLAVDADQIPHIVVFYRYLADLTSEHQQYWNSFQAPHVPMCEEYFKSSILGDWWENRSIRFAIQEEMRLVNEMTKAVFGKKLFRHEMTDELPFDLSAFLVPSSENFGTFIHSWDKLLSDNLNKEFFKGRVGSNFEQTLPDGRVSVHPKGTITLLQEWLEKVITGNGKAKIIDAIVSPIRKIRQLRQEPAHKFQENQFSLEFHRRRREVLEDVLGSLSCCRVVLARHRKARGIDVPDWLDSEKIHVF